LSTNSVHTKCVERNTNASQLAIFVTVGIQTLFQKWCVAIQTFTILAPAVYYLSTLNGKNGEHTVAIYCHVIA
jgi:hypothetical protein